MKKTTKLLVSAALLAALTCVATMVIKIPSPFKGYLNLGDCAVLLAGWLLLPGYGFLSAGIGSALADVFSGYAIYAPATFIVKGLTALAACGVSNLLNKKLKDLPVRIISGITGEAVMVIGYFIFEGFMYGFASSAVNIAPNALQGVAGIILGVLLMKVLQKAKIKI